MNTLEQELLLIGLRTPPRVYGASTIPGFVAVVLEVKKGVALVLSCDMDKVRSESLTIPELVARYEPDVTRSRLSIAEQLRSCAATYFAADSVTTAARLQNLLETLMKHKPNTVKELKKTAAKPGKMIKVKVEGTSELIKGAPKPHAGPTVCADHNRRTTIELSRVDGTVVHVPLISDTFDTMTEDASAFDQRFTPVEGYPAECAARLFVGYAQHTGATNAAIHELGRLTTITKQEKEIMVAKAKTVVDKKPAAAAKTEVKEKIAPKEKSKTPAKAAVKKAVAKGKQPAALKAAKEKSGPTAATRFRELIMAGKLTDDQIFATVQKEFGLDDKKRTYVAWYRNDLDKKGEKPPAAKEAKK